MGRHQPPPGVGAVAMPGSKKDKQEGRKAYTNTWAAGDIHKACCANPGFCCVALFWCVHRAPSRVATIGCGHSLGCGAGIFCRRSCLLSDDRQRGTRASRARARVARASARRRASTAASRPRAEERARRRCATAPSMSCRHTKRHDTRKDVDTRGICSAVQAASADLAQTFDFQRTVRVLLLLYCMRS